MARRGRRAVLALVVLAVGAVLVLAAARSGLRDDPPPAAPLRVAGEPVYQCAMHPQIVAHEPGSCPICGMRLQRVEPSAAAELERAAPAAGGAADVHAGHAAPRGAVADDGSATALVPAPAAGGDAAAPPGRAAFTLTPERQQLIGVKRGRVERRPLALEVRAAGRIAYDPALYQALVEYREAVRAERTRTASAAPQLGSDAMVRAARLKLRQLGLSDALLRDLTASGADPVELLLPGASAWVYAQVFEHESSLVAPGQTVAVTMQSHPGRTFAARVVGVDPIVDPATRTVRVRALLATDGAVVRAESLVDARIAVPLGERLAVPRDAVLDSGERRIVFVVRDAGTGDDRASGLFTPRTVELGHAAGDWYEVRSGLDAGDEVVTSANFLIDSESKIRAALAAFQAPGGDGGAAAGAHRH